MEREANPFRYFHRRFNEKIPYRNINFDDGRAGVGANVVAKPDATNPTTKVMHKTGDHTNCSDTTGWTAAKDLEDARLTAGAGGVLSICAGTYTGTMTDNANYKLRIGSGLIDAGVDLCGVTASCTASTDPYACCTGEGTGNCIANSTDFYGKPQCVSGVFVGRLSSDIGMSMFPTVGQSTQKSLNLLWLGK